MAANKSLLPKPDGPAEFLSQASNTRTMKSKLLISGSVLAALVAGFFLGQWQSRRTVDGYVAKLLRPEVRRARADFSHAAGLLKAVRSGNTNEAIATLEEDLDSNILVIRAAVEATPASERDKQSLSRIRWLRDYRAEHPRKTEFAVIDEEIAHILTLVETNR